MLDCYELIAKIMDTCQIKYQEPRTKKNKINSHACF